jgi:hypothetical protein
VHTSAASNPEWFCQRLTVEDTGALSQSDIEPERRSGMREELIQQEFYCDFSAGAPRAIYAKAIEKARSDGRVCPMPVDGSNLVHTNWDLGAPRKTAVWYWQIVGREIRVIDCDIGFEGTIAERVARILGKGYNLRKHYLPHDAQQTERSGSTFASELARAGLPNLVTVPRTHSVWIGINHALELFPALSFRSPHCDKRLEALEAYRSEVEGEGALSRNEPEHDWSSHQSDAFRMMAEAHRAGLVRFTDTTAAVNTDWLGLGLHRHGRRGMKPIRVSS